MKDDIVKPPATDTPSAPPVEQTPAPVQDVAKPPEPAPAPPPEQEAPAQVQEPNNEPTETKVEEPREPTEPAKQKRGLPKFVIGFASVICLGLVGTVVYLAMNGGVEQKVGNAKTPSSQNSQSTSPQGSQNELNSLSNEASTLPDPGTDPASDLTDQALGL